MTTATFAWFIYTTAAVLEIGLVVLKPGRLTRVTVGSLVLLLLSSSHSILLLNTPVVFGVSFLEFLMSQADKILIGFYLNVRQVGVYWLSLNERPPG